MTDMRAKIVLAVASRGHDAWREPRKLPDGTYDPRIKETTDKVWIEQHGTNQVDIANLAYADLPSDWQAENRAAGEDVAELIEPAFSAGGDVLDAHIETYAMVIHDKWCLRNPKHYQPELLVSYSLLPEDEKEKDREKLRIGIAAARE